MILRGGIRAMGLKHWFSGWSAGKRNSSITRRHKPVRKRRAWGLAVEALEDRIVPSLVTWTNPGSGNWDTAANWSGGSVPGAGDDVVINTAAAATVTVLSGDAESVLSLTTAGTDTMS